MKNCEKKGAVIIKPDGTTAPYIPKKGSSLTGEEMRKIVGGYIQTVSDGKFSMVMDEDGKLKGYRPNRYATAIARTLRMIFPTDYLVGDVILCPSQMIR